MVTRMNTNYSNNNQLLFTLKKGRQAVTPHAFVITHSLLIFESLWTWLFMQPICIRFTHCRFHRQLSDCVQSALVKLSPRCIKLQKKMHIIYQLCPFFKYTGLKLHAWHCWPPWYFGTTAPAETLLLMHTRATDRPQHDTHYKIVEYNCDRNYAALRSDREADKWEKAHATAQKPANCKQAKSSSLLKQLVFNIALI